MIKKILLILTLVFLIDVTFAANCTSNCTYITNVTQQETQVNFSSIFVMFTIISLFLAVYFSYNDKKAKEKYETASHEGMSFKVPQAPQNILLISFCWFMFIVSSYISLLYILETGYSGGNAAYILTTLYTLILTVIFIYLLVKYKDVFVDKIKEWGFL